MSRTFALIPAAGKSSRMGTPKLALPVGSRTVLQCVVDSVRRAGVADILVVTGPHLQEIGALATSAGADGLPLEHETADMRATVEHGLAWIAEHWKPANEDGWLLLPADHPTVDANVVDTLLDARRAFPEKSLFVPTYQGRRGHPTWVSWKHVAGIRDFPRDKGLNLFFRTLASATQEVPVDSPTVLWDLDTPEDYAELLSFMATHLNTT